ncbi:hypothetical protein SpCBS45565_g03344 [Spizellomyces sp. 'palustris']|nr:hypothetical protein SpCBS45565_g03344 [Spizellomyces sp. 'palustris']
MTKSRRARSLESVSPLADLAKQKTSRDNFAHHNKAESLKAPTAKGKELIGDLLDVNNEWLQGERWSYHSGTGARWQFRASAVAEKRYTRLVEHLNRFIRLHIISSAEPLTVIVDAQETIEDLAQRIEVEVFARALEASDGDLDLTPFECCLLYDANMIALNFSDRIEDVLGHDEDVHVMTVTECEKAEPADDVEVVAETKQTVGPSERRLSTHHARNFESAKTRTKHLSLDEKLQNVLHHKVGLERFVQFCASDHTLEKLLFWIDVEILQDVPLEYVGPYGRYIFMTYINDGCPLPVNLRPQAKLDVTRSMAVVTRATFDECQEMVYNSLKGQSFGRFVKHQLYKEYDEQRQAGGPSYKMGFLHASYFEMAPPDWELVQQLISTLENPVLQNQNTFTSFFPPSDGSMPFQVQVLTVILRHYFPHMSTPATYFRDAQYASAAKRKSRINKDKKLTKFFGARPSGDQIYRQLAKTNPRVEIGHDEVEDTKQENQEEKVVPENISKKRRFSKLHNFFGENLPKPQLKAQNLATRQDSVASLSRNEGKVTGRARSHTIHSYTPPLPRRNQNELDPTEKKRLVKQKLKIKAVLGAPFGEVLCPNPLFRRRSYSIDSLLLSPKTEATTSGVQLSERKSRSETAVSSADGSGVRLQGKTATDCRLSSQESSQSITRGSDSLEDNDRSRRRKRVQKLLALLGEGFPAATINDAASSVKPKSPVTLSPEMRQEHVRRNSKLERVFGKVPPSNLVAGNHLFDPHSAASAHQRAIQGLSMFIQNENGVVDLMEKMAAFDEGPRNGDSEEDMGSEAEKMKKRKQTSKLQKFFGDDFAGMTYMLEHAIESQIENPEELCQLRAELTQLRAELNKRNEEIRKGLDTWRKSFVAE